MNQVLGVSHYMLSKVRDEFKKGVKNHIHGNKGNFYFSGKRDKAIGFIEHFSKVHCENSPDKIQRVLPGYMTIKLIYTNYRESRPEDQIIGEREFYRVFRDNFGSTRKFSFLPRIVMQSSNSHPKCSKCSEFNDLRKKHQGSELDLRLLEGEKRIHMNEIRNKYLNFVSRQELSISQPNDYLSIGIGKYSGIFGRQFLPGLPFIYLFLPQT